MFDILSLKSLDDIEADGDKPDEYQYYIWTFMQEAFNSYSSAEVVKTMLQNLVLNPLTRYDESNEGLWAAGLRAASRALRRLWVRGGSEEEANKIEQKEANAERRANNKKRNEDEREEEDDEEDQEGEKDDADDADYDPTSQQNKKRKK